METVETENKEHQPGTGLPQPPSPSPDPKKPAEQGNQAPATERSSSPVGSFLGGLFKRNGRHPKDCQCPIHRKAEGDSRFTPPPVPAPVASTALPDPPAVPPNPARFEMWGRLAARAVKTLHSWLTAKTPGLIRRVTALAPDELPQDEADQIIKALPITADEIADIQSSGTRLAEKYNLTTGFDEEIEFGITVGSVLGRCVLVNRRLEAVVGKLEEKAA